MRHDQRCGQDEYHENRDPPALAITTLDLTNVGDKVVNGNYPVRQRNLLVNISNVSQLDVFCLMFFPSEFLGRAGGA